MMKEKSVNSKMESSLKYLTRYHHGPKLSATFQGYKIPVATLVFRVELKKGNVRKGKHVNK